MKSQARVSPAGLFLLFGLQAGALSVGHPEQVSSTPSPQPPPHRYWTCSLADCQLGPLQTPQGMQGAYLPGTIAADNA